MENGCADFPQRKKIRFDGFDYGNGTFFITICSHNRQCIFAYDTIGQGLCSCRLTHIGKIVYDEIQKLESRFLNVKIRNFCVMPNHVHLLFDVNSKRQEQSPCPIKGAANQNFKVPDIVCALKSISTRRANKIDGIHGRKIWQSRYHMHVVNDINEYVKVDKYITENPIKWNMDCYF